MAARRRSEIDVFGLQQNPSSPVEPTPTMTSSYALTNFEARYWTGSAWATVPGGSVTGNNKVWRQFTFSPITTTKIRVVVNGGADNTYSRVVEVEAWNTPSPPSSVNINWLVADQLGTPRMIFDKTGSLATTKRHDYLPFGEELFAGVGGRTPTLGYTGDTLRQQFSEKERDNETGLDYFLARYHSSTQGRFTSFDPEGAGARESDPQSWNGYAYAGGNPVLFSDPDGREYLVCGPNGNDGKCTRVSDEAFAAERKKLKKDGNVYTGSGNFYESGQIKNAEGGVVATYVQFSIDDLQHRQLAAIAAAVDPIPMATLQFFGLSAVLGVGGGAIAYVAPGAVPLIAPAVEKLSVTGPSAGLTLMSQAQNPKLRSIIDALYRATAQIGSGSTADAIRYERTTGKMLSGAGHSIKGRESIRALESLIRSGKLNPAETNTARFIINDLKDALATPTNPLSIK